MVLEDILKRVDVPEDIKEQIRMSIIESKQSKEELQKISRQLTSVIESSRDVIAMMDTEYRYILFNSAFHDEFKKIFGQDLKLGDSMTQALGHLPNDLADAMKHWDRVFSGEHFIVIQEFGDIKLERKWYELHFSPIRNGDGKIVGGVHIVRDITERKRAEETLIIHSAVIETVAEGIFFIGLEDNIIKWTNRKFEELFGYGPGEMVGMHVDKVNAPTEKTSTETRISIVDVLQQTGEWHGEIKSIKKDGTHFWSYIHVSLFNHPEFGTVMVSAHTDITESKRAVKSLRESEEKYRTLVEQTTDGILMIDPKGDYVDANSGICRMLGYSKDEILSMNMKQLASEEDVSNQLDTFEKMLKGENVLTERQLRCKNGSYLNAELNAKMLPDGRFCAFVRDITERKRAENALRESEDRFRAFIEQSPMAIGVFSMDGNGLYANQLFIEVLGLNSVEDVIGRPAYEYFVPQFREDSKERTRRRLQGLPVPTEYESICLRSDGSEFPVDMAVAPIQLATGTVSIAFLTDITERKHAEEELKKSHTELEETLAKLKETQKQVLQQEKLRSLGQMASGVCHDINNSLTPIMGFLDLLTRDKGLMERSKKYIEMVIQSTKNIASTVGRLKEFYKVKLESDNLTERDINRIINTTIDLTNHKWKNIAESTGAVIEIKRELQKYLPLTKVNESELIEALTNVILNACDAMHDGGTLTFRTFQKEENVVIEVQDTGIGMEEEILQKCIDPFFSTKGEQGTGLGLSMVFGVMERHKGEIKIESEKNKGTTVRLILPIDKSIIENDKIDEIVKDLKPLKILSVEDDKVISEMLKLILETKGNSVELALNGKVGLELYKQAIEKREPFDLVITDLGMAEMDGNSLSKAIKEITPDVPVILLTGWGTLIDKNDYKTVDCLLKKPIMMEDLFKAIAELFEEK